MKFNSLIPELTVQNIERTKAFYIDLLGFKLEYERKDDKFAFVSMREAQIMLEELHFDGWITAELVYPFGRGVNFSIETEDIEGIYAALTAAAYPLFRPMTLSSYEVDGVILEQKEFLVQDPDGYLLRFTG